MSFTIAHLSDAHIGPLPRPTLKQLMGKRGLGYINWRRGRDRAHDMDLLRRVVADLLRHRPDHVAMTGDVLNISLPGEYPAASAWLRTLGEPADVSFTPGNHDAYVRDSMAHLASAFAPWTTSDQPIAGGASFPFLRSRGDVALIGLCSGAPSGPLMATGRLGARQLAALASILEETGGRGLARVIMIHHPATHGGAPLMRRLVDARELEAVVQKAGAELILHGHNHVRSVVFLASPASRTVNARVPVIGVPSASSASQIPRLRASYHLVRLERDGPSWRISARARGPVSDGREIGEQREIDL
ncbi:MAG TPA: metallophosphoesterase, partial [Roseiarcus sp.]|nr:metallophosphoesterase [Roseiarcus sp.]